MTKKQEFIQWVENLINAQKEPVEPSEGAKDYFEALKSAGVKEEKPAFTENGAAILRSLQKMPAAMYKASDIAEALFTAPKSVSGAMRKLVSEGYVEKVGKDPVVYAITEKGKNVDFEGEN